jgi:5-methylcytosine-specific restriction endonuclease McrA
VDIAWDEAVCEPDGTVVKRFDSFDRVLQRALRIAVRQFEERESERATARLKTMPYQEYLRTKHWQAVRAVAIGRADGRCQLCGATEQLNVHHNTYERRGEELTSDVVALCSSCHAKHHDIVGSSRNGQRRR